MVEPVRSVESIDKSQWKPEEYDLCYYWVNFARMANSVVTDPGPLQGWFSEALWRHYSYAPFNARVMENYHSLAFFYGYNAPWNLYYRDPAVLERLEYALTYTFGLMAENGAIPEYAPADLDSPMLAPSSFGMEYMAGALEVAGDVLPADLRARLIAQARKAAVYVLTSQESWAHARAYTNQFLGAMAGGARLARLTDDRELMALVVQAGDALLEESHFISPMGFLYENNGPETFSYFFTTLSRLVPLYHEWKDPRVLEVLRRHCAWMSRWMLPEPDGDTLILAGSHQTRTGSGYRVARRGFRGLGTLMVGGGQGVQSLDTLRDDGSDERRFLDLLLRSQEEEMQRRQQWEADEDLVASLRRQSLKEGYQPVPTLSCFPAYAPPAAQITEARGALPCLEPKTSCEVQGDDRGNQYVTIRHPAYYVGLAFSTRHTAAQHGPGFLWHPDGGTLILSENGDRACWETRLGASGTGKAAALAEVREGRGGYEVILRYDELGLAKTTVYRPEEIDVLVRVSRGGEQTPSERIPLLLREDDVLHLDYGCCVAGGMGNRVLGVVTRTLGIERAGRRLLTLDVGAPVSASFKPTYDADGYVRAELVFPLPALYFGRTGYRVRIER